MQQCLRGLRYNELFPALQSVSRVASLSLLYLCLPLQMFGLATLFVQTLTHQATLIVGSSSFTSYYAVKDDILLRKFLSQDF